MTANPKYADSRQLNRLTVINLVKTHPKISRADLAKRTGLNKSTIGKLVQELLDEHWLQEDHTPTPLDGAGRRPTGLTLNGNVLALLGAEIGVDYITVLACSITGETLFNSTLPFAHDSVDGSLNQLVELLTHAWRIMDNMQHQVLGLGIAVPGLVNAFDDLIIELPNLNWHNVAMAEQLRERFTQHQLPNIPISIINDANAAALSEFVFGHTQYRRSALVHLTIGIGLGAGIITEKGLYRGFNGWAGELGHSILQPINGHLCRCGQRGCVETLVSQRALSRMVSNNNALLSIDTLQRRLAKDDEAVKQGLNSIGQHLGIVLRNIANILDPETIVIGGPMSAFAHHLLEPTLASFQAHTGLNHILPKIQLCEFGHNAAALGAAAAILSQHVEPLQLAHQGLMR
ncbi:MAG: ROK family transcriptional regulator [Formosimonas sp.]